MAGLAVLAALLAAAPATAVPPGSPAAAEALAVCHRASDLSGEARAELLARSVELAEAAAKANERDALAHSAMICAFGKQLEVGGAGIGQLVGLYRLRRAIDKTLELAPDDADTLTAKGALLVRLPRLLGGDRAEAAALLRRALVVEPENGTAKCYLAAAERGGGNDPHC
jgi:hypothetical protein